VYSRAKKNGVNYFVSGGGGAPLYGRKKKSETIDLDATKFFERVNHHLRVHIVGRHVEVSAVRADGTLIESISWGQLPWVSDNKGIAPTMEMPSAVQRPARGGGTADLPPEGVRDPAEHRGFGLLGLLGALMTLSAGVVVFWAWRQ